MPHPYESLGLVRDKHAVIIDIGAAYTKCGFASEFSPRAIVPSEVDDWESGLKGRVVDFTRKRPEQLKILKKFFHNLYYKHLLVGPKERRVVLVESVLSPTEFREMLGEVLFSHLEVPSVLFAPSHLMATFPLGTPNALVVDVGYSETLVLPIFESVPMLNCWEASPSCAAKALHSNISSLVKEHCRVKTGDMDEMSVSECPDVVTESLIEDVKAKLCFVTHMDRGRQIQGAILDKTPDKLPTPPPDVCYSLLEGDKTLKIPGIIRESSAEVFFHYDDDEKSIPQLILDSILRCPIDLRKPMCEKILVTGGGSMLPGFLTRLKAELHDLVSSKYKDKLPIQTFKFYKLPSQENICAWVGGSIFGALEVLPHRSLSKEDFEQRKRIPDWTTRIELEDSEDNGGKGERK